MSAQYHRLTARFAQFINHQRKPRLRFLALPFELQFAAK
jgi:hypothetical protein